MKRPAAAPRLFVDLPLAELARARPRFDLPEPAMRHVQALRLQPGAALVLFDGRGGSYAATIIDMKRRVAVELTGHSTTENEASTAVELAFGLFAAERIDWLVEKATELGAARLQPLLTQHASLRLDAERSARKTAHWQAVARAACEQCGRNRVPEVAAPLPLAAWLEGLPQPPAAPRLLLAVPPAPHEAPAAPHPAPAAPQPAPAAALPGPAEPLRVLSGPEGGLSAAERAQAQAAGFVCWTLGPRVLRAETAPLAALARLLQD